ncbi:MAG: hypothetical protein WA869_02075 [Alloacidobacterium sp.]|jgi:hypothetical protein
MTDSPRIPYLLWPLAILFGFILGYVANVIEKNWRQPKQRRSAGWRAEAVQSHGFLRQLTGGQAL